MIELETKTKTGTRAGVRAYKDRGEKLMPSIGAWEDTWEVADIRMPLTSISRALWAFLINTSVFGRGEVW